MICARFVNLYWKISNVQEDSGRRDIRTAAEASAEKPSQPAGGTGAWHESMIGQTVTLTQTEATTTGVLRGVIAGTSHGASLSKKYLLGRGTPARMLAGKDLRIRLTRWDENAQKFNAELG